MPDPIEFIKLIAQLCKIIGLHIPLDYTLNTTLRNLFRSNLKEPGHLLCMDAMYALNLLTLAGLRIVDYEYTPGFFAPSGHKTILQKAAFPFRWLLAKVSPWLAGKTIGGVCLMAIAVTPKGLTELDLTI